MPTYTIATIEGLPAGFGACRSSARGAGPSVLPLHPMLPSMTEAAGEPDGYDGPAAPGGAMPTHGARTRVMGGSAPSLTNRAVGVTSGPNQLVPSPNPRSPQADADSWKAEMIARAADVEEALREMDEGDASFAGQAVSAGIRMAEAAVRSEIARERARWMVQARAAEGRGDVLIARRGRAALIDLAQRDAALADALRRLRRPEPADGYWTRRTLTTWVRALPDALAAECRQTAPMAQAQAARAGRR